MPDPLPLACVITELDPGGAERAFVRVVVGLGERGWAPHVFALSRGRAEGGLRGELDAAGVPVSVLKAEAPRGLGITGFVREFRRERPRAILSFLFHANLLARLAAPLAGRPPVVCGVRVAERRRNGHRTLDRLTAPLVDRWVCVGESVRRFCVEEVRLPANRVLTIPNGVDEEVWGAAAPADRAALGLSPDARAVLFAGRLDEQKDPETLLAAFAGLDRPGVRLLIAGDGPLAPAVRRWEERTGGEALALGRRDDLPALMRLATAFVLPSRWEGTPNVLLEAAAAGTPIVATAVDGTAEVFTHGDTARLVPLTGGAADPGALRRELRWVLDHPAAAAAMADRAQRHVLARHRWPAVIGAYDRLLRGLLR